jgi:hypothetical protein
MVSKQSAAVVEPTWPLRVGVAVNERPPRDSRLSMDDRDAIAHPVDWSRPRVVA